MVEDLRQQLERLVSGRLGTTHLRRPERVRSRPIEELVGGEVVVTDHGPCVLVDLAYPAGYRHGHVDIGAALDLNPHTVAALGRDHEDVEEAVPFDHSLKGMLPCANQSA